MIMFHIFILKIKNMVYDLLPKTVFHIDVILKTNNIIFYKV